jgi:hypothetical protein
MQGINFTEPLFHKVVSGEKVMMRQIINSKMLDELDEYWSWYEFACAQQTSEISVEEDRTQYFAYYKPGITLYLKEPYCIDSGNEVLYKYSKAPAVRKCIKWKNPCYMAAKHARFFIEITGVRAEWLHEINEKDAKLEGIEELNAGEIIRGYSNYIQYSSDNGITCYNTPREAYAALIDSINGKGTWESNPFIWCYSFELTDKK